MTKDVKYVINLACNMGGIGFIENNKADCAIGPYQYKSFRACKENKVEKFFSSSACAYNKDLQQDPNIDGLRRRRLSSNARRWIWMGKII